MMEAIRKDGQTRETVRLLGLAKERELFLGETHFPGKIGLLPVSVK